MSCQVMDEKYSGDKIQNFYYSYMEDYKGNIHQKYLWIITHSPPPPKERYATVKGHMYQKGQGAQ